MQNEKGVAKKKVIYSMISGGFASALTQPFEVIKTVQLCQFKASASSQKSSNTLRAFLETSRDIFAQDNRGFLNFFRGGSVGCLRQALGFAIYSQTIEKLDAILPKMYGFTSIRSDNTMTQNNIISPAKINKDPINLASLQKNELTLSQQQPTKYKYIRTALIAGVSKTLAIVLTCPLIVLKTRLELVVGGVVPSLTGEARTIFLEGGYFRGLGVMLSRELAFSVVQYTMYQFLREIFRGKDALQKNTFVAPYLSALMAVLLSHPFEVLRNRMMITHNHLPQEYRYKSLIHGVHQILRTQGIPGFFQGLIPRLVRKPINTAFSWGIYELLNKQTLRKSH